MIAFLEMLRESKEKQLGLMRGRSKETRCNRKHAKSVGFLHNQQ